MISRVEREVMEILNEAGFGSQSEQQGGSEFHSVVFDKYADFTDKYTLLKTYAGGGGIWVPTGKETGYEEFRDKNGQEMPVATVESPADLKWNI